MKRSLIVLLITLAISCLGAISAHAQRKVTPVNNKSTASQPINELEGDTARINARMRASMAHYHDENGNVVYVDTVTGREWRDSTAIKQAKKTMQYPLFHSVAIGADVWSPLMRSFGQRYGLIGFTAQVSFHNRYIPVFDIGLGQAKSTPADMNFTYKSPVSVYFKLGMDYNFLYNSNSDYQFFAGLRFGFSPFSYSIDNITIDSPYWGETATPSIPSQNSTALWMEFCLGLKVKLAGPISAGWTFSYHSMMHESVSQYGEPWYIPGFGTRGSSISGAFTIYYTLRVYPIINVNAGAVDF